MAEDKRQEIGGGAHCAFVASRPGTESSGSCLFHNLSGRLLVTFTRSGSGRASPIAPAGMEEARGRRSGHAGRCVLRRVGTRFGRCRGRRCRTGCSGGWPCSRADRAPHRGGVLTDTGYVGHDVHRAARIAAAAHGGQTLLSNSTRDLVDAAVRDLGPHRLRAREADRRRRGTNPGAREEGDSTRPDGVTTEAFTAVTRPDWSRTKKPVLPRYGAVVQTMRSAWPARKRNGTGGSCSSSAPSSASTSGRSITSSETPLPFGVTSMRFATV